ncbi:hypothetical protein KBD45_00580 [Candidatus Dojkabacteria bacterium]|nr:hypothetical protein [Candidatus Dojkabacteria bacterium]
MNNITKSNFNLIPKEIYTKREKKRQTQDKTILFSSILPFLAIVVWLIFLVLRLGVKNELNIIESEKNKVDVEIQKYETEKLTNAELVLKTRLLKEIVKNDVNPEDFFRIVQDTIVSSGKKVSVLEYGKNSTGNFSIKAQADDIINISDIVRIFRELDRLADVKLLTVSAPEGRESVTYEFEMTFKILPEVKE